MTNIQLDQAIRKVAVATNKSKEQVAAKLKAKDWWTWYLVEEAAK